MQQTDQDRALRSRAKHRDNGTRAEGSEPPPAEPIELTALSETAAPEPEAGPAPGEDAPPETLRREPNVYASAIWLMQLSRRHRHLFLADLEWALMPPLALQQFRLFHKDSVPIAQVTWAFVSAEVEERLTQGRMRLKPEEWKSGDICWLIDVVAPPAVVPQIVQDVMKNALAGRTVKYFGHDPKRGKTNV